jgi:hypothetical protein
VGHVQGDLEGGGDLGEGYIFSIAGTGGVCQCLFWGVIYWFEEGAERESVKGEGGEVQVALIRKCI